MIYVITGPTGVGKTKLSIMLAKKKNAIVLNADSMQVYKELNIGTAKITEEEKEGIPHYLFDVKSITEDFNVYLYQQMGRELLEKFKQAQKEVRPAVEAMLAEADQIAESKSGGYSLEDVFGTEDEE